MESGGRPGVDDELHPYSCTIANYGRAYHYLIDAPSLEQAMEVLWAHLDQVLTEFVYWDVGEGPEWRRAWQRGEVTLLKWRKPPANLR